MKLSIIIINYKSEKYIEECIKSINFHKPYELIIVDNENNPELMDKLKKKYYAKIIHYEKNLGFSGANNKAIKTAKGEYILTLNADVFLTGHYISECMAFLENNPKYSSVQGKLISYTNKDLIDSTGNVMTTLRFGYNENHKVKDYPVESHEIFGCCAAASLYRKKALLDVQIPFNNNEIFDEDFFAYLEDLDLDWRLRKKGWKSYFLNKAVAYHIRESSTKHSYRMFQALKNRLFMVIKNDSSFSCFLNIIFYAPVVLILCSGRLKNIILIKKMLQKRKIIQKNAKVSDNNFRYLIKKSSIFRWLNISKFFKLFT